jgi:hypothetical protein
MITLMPHQKEVLPHLGSGKVLHGGVGSGKSATALAYYVQSETPADIVVITTAKKRDSLDWLSEALKFHISVDRDTTRHGTIEVDSWNNIGNYVDRRDCFFIFDEQRLVGYGAWVKAFLEIAKSNRWLMLSATPGDTWLDFAPVLIANGFYRNITHFKREHVLYEPFMKFPKIKGYLNEQKLEWLRNDILVEMTFIRHTTRHIEHILCGFDKAMMKRIYNERWNIYTDEPCKDAAEMFRVMRRLVNSDPSRLDNVLDVLKKRPRLIIFYNFDYELDILRSLNVTTPTFEYNGHVKDPVPECDEWVYLTQYVAASEAWNCVTTDSMILYSQTYSYKNHEQAQGRTDRLDTKYTDLWYGIFVSNSLVDRGIRRALSTKKNFNERKFMEEMLELDEMWGELHETGQI